MSELYDCIIVGGGIAGLTAGIYLARFKCKIAIVDNNDSRANLIRCSHNFPGFPDGISGSNILSKLKKQYKNYQEKIIDDTITKITRKNNIFFIKGKKNSLKARFIILATGVVDIEPSITDLTAAIKNGLIRHCLICDAYEASGKKIVVIGNSNACIKQALMLRTYTDNVTVLKAGSKVRLNKQDLNSFRKYGIKIVDEKNYNIIVKNNKIKSINTKEGALKFDVIYSSLGAVVRSDFAIKLGTKHDKNKSLLVNHHQETSVKGLYAAGDVVKGINQMCTATSHGAIAAIDIFNKLMVIKQNEYKK